MYVLNTELLRRLPSMLGIPVRDFLVPLDICQTTWNTSLVSSNLRLVTLVSLCNTYHIPVFYVIVNRSESVSCPYDYMHEALESAPSWKGDIKLHLDRLSLIYRNHIGGCTRDLFYSLLNMSPANYSHNIHNSPHPSMRVSTLLDICNRFNDNPLRMFTDPNFIPSFQSLSDSIAVMEQRMQSMERYIISIESRLASLNTDIRLLSDGSRHLSDIPPVLSDAYPDR